MSVCLSVVLWVYFIIVVVTIIMRQKTHEGQRTACHVRVLLPCGFWGPNSVLQFWQQASLHAESLFGPLFLSLSL